MAMTMIGCNYVNTSFAVMLLMSIAFFGKGIGALGWTVISDTSPKDLIGINGGLFNLIGNLAGITTPIVIGLIVKHTGSFQWRAHLCSCRRFACDCGLPADCGRDQAARDSANLFRGAVTE